MVEKIVSYVEGNLKMLADKFQLLDWHKKEQVLYRMNVCKHTCLPKGKCEVCGCTVPNKMYSMYSCDTKKFPDMMGKEEWEKYKKENNIHVQRIDRD
jgi:hypothetical protein